MFYMPDLQYEVTDQLCSATTDMGLAHTHLIIALDCQTVLKPLTYLNT